MNRSRLRNMRLAADLHAVLLVLSLAGLLGFLGFLIGGRQLAFAAAAGSAIIYLLSPQVAPWLLLKSMRARPLQPFEAPQLYRVIEAQATRAGLRRRPSLYLLPHSPPAAFTAGDGDKAVIAVSQGLVDLLNLRELTGVLAHEISHIRHKDTRIMGFAQTMTQMTSTLSTLGQILLILSLPMVIVSGHGVSAITLLVLILAPLLSSLLQLALSRVREYAADMGAADLLGAPGPLAEALYRLDRHAKSMQRRLPWLFARPGRAPDWLSTHPPTEERIRRLMQTQPSSPRPVPHLLWPSEF